MLTIALAGFLLYVGSWIYRETSQQIASTQRKLYLTASTQRVLEPGELVDERKKLDADAQRLGLAGFTRLGDFVEIYGPETGLSVFSKNPFRALVDDQGTTVALIFRLADYTQSKQGVSTIVYRDDTTRVSLSTAFSDEHWIVTQKTFGLTKPKPALPAEIDVKDFDWEIPLDELVAKHAARVAAATDHQEEGYRGAAATSDVMSIRTLDQYLADHRRRRELIQAKHNAS